MNDGKYLCCIAGFAGGYMSNHHVYQSRCTAKDLRASILQEGLHVLAKGGGFEVYAKLAQHLLDTAFMLS